MSFSGGNTTQFPWPVPFPGQRKAALESCVRLATTLVFYIQNESRTKILKILRWYHQANELQLPPSLKPVKALSQMTTT